jgi:putative FmdB family regulatory protein
MPTYEYACPKCGYRFEQFQTMSSEPLKKCPKCKKAGVKRLIGAGAGLIFKGTGFYITDYKKSAPPKEGGEGKSDSGDAKSGGGDGKPAGGESKTAEKSGESKGAAADSKSPPAAPKADKKKP